MPLIKENPRSIYVDKADKYVFVGSANKKSLFAYQIGSDVTLMFL